MLLGSSLRRGSCISRGSRLLERGAQTALAEAEVEYADRGPGNSRKFPIVSARSRKASMVIWTTTPWTLPANVAIAVKHDCTYWLGRFVMKKPDAKSSS